MDLLPSQHPSCPRGGSHGRVCPSVGLSPSPARLGDPVVRRSRLAAALWSGCGRSQKNVSYYCLFLPGFSPPLPANKAFPIAEHTATTSLPSSRSPGPSSILVLSLLLSPHPSPRLFPPSFPVFIPWCGHGHHHFTLSIPRSLAGAWSRDGDGNVLERCCGNDLVLLGHPSCSSPHGDGALGQSQGDPWLFHAGPSNSRVQPFLGYLKTQARQN